MDGRPSGWGSFSPANGNTGVVAGMANGKRMLIADDDPGMRLVSRIFAEDEGWEVIGEAETGKDAVTLARRCLPDVVLMDFRMPEIDGATATRRIRRTHPDVAVIGWSSDIDPGFRAAFLEAGAYAVAAKGDLDMLRALLRQAQPA